MATAQAQSTEAQGLKESRIREIELEVPWRNALLEYSGLSWCDDTLIILPQYPERLANLKAKAHVLTVTKQEISHYLSLDNPPPLKPKALELDMGDIRTRLPAYEGFESVSCKAKQLWFSIELTQRNRESDGALVKGVLLSGDTAKIQLQYDSIQLLPSLSRYANKGYEAMFLYQGKPVVLHEINQTPHAQQPRAFILQNGNLDTVTITPIPYRLTGATELDANGRFWVSNYQWRKARKLARSQDVFAQIYGKGVSHMHKHTVERLIELQWVKKDTGQFSISASQRPPIYLQLPTDKGRNWEGIVRFTQQGFLLVSDTYPKNSLVFLERMPSP